MKTTDIRTKGDLVKWITEQQQQSNYVPFVLNGVGYGKVGLDDDMTLLLEDDDYSDEVEYIEKGTEFDEFKEILSGDEYTQMTFVRLPHKTGYNQENQDYQFGIWE